MSDFTSGFWSLYISAITLISILACLPLLWFSGKAKAMTAHDNTTGHVWDGDLREMNNPLPRWWVWLFVITVVFALVYLVLYPGLGTYAGQLGWTSTGQHAAEMKKGEAEVAPLYARFDAMTTEDIAKDPQATAIGERLFMNNCSQCHASDARGSKGFPNLTDGDWLHGGNPEQIIETITNGRMGNMPALGVTLGTTDDVKNVAQYVRRLRCLSR
jgi:cytochrome c oxidase cbb3-type subunit 3